MEKIIWISIVSLILIAGCSASGSLFKEQPLPQPTGPYKVGTLLLDSTDQSRMDPFSETGEKRRLSIQVFYPAASSSEGEFLPAMDPRISKAFSKLYHIPTGSSEETPSHSMIQAEGATDGPYPVILFSHGGFSFNTQNLSTFEDLASNGYIVFAVSHTYEAILSLFSETEEIAAADISYIRNASKMEKSALVTYREELDILRSEAAQGEKKESLQRLGSGFYAELEPFLKVRLEDIHYVLQELEIWNNADFPFSGQMDLTRTGMFGHSLGGITTSYICSEEDTPVQAGINLDAPVIQYPGYDLYMQRPFAFFYSTGTTLPKIGKLDMTGTNSYYVTDSDQRIFSLSFKDSSHYNFSDFNFMPPIMKFTPMLGNIDGPLMAKEMNRAILAFFDLTLKSDESAFYSSGDVDSEVFTLH